MNASTQRIAFNRREAADLLGVSVDVLKAAQAAGRLKAKNTKLDEKGRPVGRTLYALEDLRAWFDGLSDA